MIATNLVSKWPGFGPAPAERAAHRGRVHVYGGRHDEAVRISNRDAAGR